ncbi:MAG: MATE family efflux transporter [Ruminococcaceae bacterium]|nr:MATE family efflux transporter [Oscillospiraceae bacterium]
MGTAPMLRLIISMSLPAMFSMLIQALYNVVDSIFVAQISENALTAVSLAFPAQMLLVSVAVGTGVGVNSLVSRRLGEGKPDVASKAATHGLVLAFLGWVVFALLGGFLSRPFFCLFDDNAEVINAGTSYLTICTVFSFGAFFTMMGDKTIQATGNMIYPMISQLLGAVINIILDPIFIFGLLGVPAMGVAGAAIATVTGQIASGIFILLVMFLKKHEIHITFRGFRLQREILRDIYAVGFPSIIMQSIGSFLVTGLNAILTQFSSAVAVLGVYYKLQSFVFMPVFGLTQGVMPIMGYNYGARNRKRLMDALRYGTIIAIIIMAAGTVLFWVAPRWLLSLFNASETMYQVGIPALRTISLCFVPAALGILFSTMFQAVGRGNRSLFVSLLRQLVIILPSAYVFSFIGVNAVWYSFPLAESVALVVSILLLVGLYRSNIKFLEK